MASEPAYRVRADLDVLVEMRDGVRLATDVYRPLDPDTGAPLETPKPALLARTPYDKRGQQERHGEWFARRGYVVAIQDCRGRYESEGEFYIWVNEPEDGHDAVEWLADQPFCDGSVGTIGTSYGAWVQSALATQDPPHLEAMFVNQGPANGHDVTFRHHGAFELRWLCWALTMGGGFAKRALENPAVQARLANVDVRDVLAGGPIQRGQSPLRHVPAYEDWLFDVMTSHDGNDELWRSPGINFAAHYDEMADVPSVYAGGWYDSYTKGTCDNFEALAERKHADQFLIVGPWTHGYDSYPLPSWNETYSGELEFGEESLRNYNRTRRRFFDHYLKGEDTWDEPPVQYFRMGTGDGAQTKRGRLFHGGEWTTAEEWPLPEAAPTRYFAHADGSLSRSKPAAESARTTYEFDPEDPVPTIGGNCSSYVTYEPRDESLLQYPLEERHLRNITGAGGYDQRTRPDTFGAEPPYGPVSARDDVVTFRTEPLAEPVEIVGPVRVQLHAATDAPDTDFTAMLLEEHPPSAEFENGFGVNLTDSICRARYRGGRDEPDFVEPGEAYRYEFELYPTANVFSAGNRIRLDVSSSNYPRYDVNHNTGERLYGGRTTVVATNTVYHDREHPSNVELPVVTE